MNSNMASSRQRRHLTATKRLCCFVDLRSGIFQFCCYVEMRQDSGSNIFHPKSTWKTDNVIF